MGPAGAGFGERQAAARGVSTVLPTVAAGGGSGASKGEEGGTGGTN
jgi:hypothetical protein